MNNNGLAVLAGLILIISGTLNIMFENFRAIITASLIIIGAIIILIGVCTDKIE